MINLSSLLRGCHGEQVGECGAGTEHGDVDAAAELLGPEALKVALQIKNCTGTM